MSVVITKRRSAKLDLVNIFTQYARQDALPAARRFLVQAEATFRRLATMPGLGTLYEPEDECYAGLRYFPVARFRNYVVFYRPTNDGIEVLRVLHGARDIGGILAEEFGTEGGSADEPDDES